MDKLVEFLTSKIGYVLVAILGFFVPGNVFMFIWNRELYMDMNVIKLIMLSFSIPFITFIPIFIIITIGYAVNEKISKVNTKWYVLIGTPVATNAVILMQGMFEKINNPLYSIKKYITHVCIGISFVALLIAIVDIIYWVRTRKNT